MIIFMKITYGFMMSVLLILMISKTFHGIFSDWMLISHYKTVLEHSSNITNYINMFGLLVVLITNVILMYSMSYVNKTNLNSYIVLMGMFALSMLVFMFSSNIFSVMLGWDGLGITSFMLVFFFSSKSSISPSVMTMLMNRVGDICMILSILLISGSFHSYLDAGMSNSKEFWLFITLVTMTKSAQFPFSAWLPAAMSAPTPTSALVHSSTLVTAGVFLLTQYYNNMTMSQKNILVFIASVTLLMASLSTISNWDLKKIIALSTLSQMSILFLMLMSTDNKILMNHLLNHAVFKALLFVSAGWIIYQSTDSQEARYANMSKMSSPIIMSSYYISLFSLMGLPFSASHYSKHYFTLYLDIVYYDYWSFFCVSLMLAMTLVYSLKLLSLSSFMSKKKTFKPESSIKMEKYSTLSLKLMTYCSLISGLILNHLCLNEVKMYPEMFTFKFMYLYVLTDAICLSYYMLLNSKSSYMWFNMKFMQMLTTMMINIMVMMTKKVEYLETIWGMKQMTNLVKMSSMKKKFFFFFSDLSIKFYMVFLIMLWSISTL